MDAAVVGVPDDKWGESVKGFVVIGENSSLKEEDIISYSRTQIAAYKCPKSIEFIKELPRNPSGKILRRELRDPYWKVSTEMYLELVLVKYVRTFRRIYKICKWQYLIYKSAQELCNSRTKTISPAFRLNFPAKR